METKEELSNLSVEELRALSSKYWKMVKAIDSIANYKDLEVPK